VHVYHDEYADAPWDSDCCHGPVSDWTSRDKRPSERVLVDDSRGYRKSHRLYDVAAAVEMARRDGWSCDHAEHTTKGARAACAVERDFQRLRAWCRDDWHYVIVDVTIRDAAGSEVASGSVCGVESDGDYWREVAAELIREHAHGLV
jgi:hypothetical protein